MFLVRVLIHHRLVFDWPVWLGLRDLMEPLQVHDSRIFYNAAVILVSSCQTCSSPCKEYMDEAIFAPEPRY